MISRAWMIEENGRAKARATEIVQIETDRVSMKVCTEAMIGRSRHVASFSVCCSWISLSHTT
eukprot:6458378-Amphidinium_carterae.1